MLEQEHPPLHQNSANILQLSRWFSCHYHFTFTIFRKKVIPKKKKKEKLIVGGGGGGEGK